MSFYSLEMQIDAMWGGNEPPRQSRAKLLMDLYALQEMSPEARLEKAERLESAFAKIGEDWEGEGFIGGMK